MKNELLRHLTALTAAAILLTTPAFAFTDDAQIQNLDAVQTLEELGVLSGQPDGAFDPARPVTRAEFAKMVSLLLTPDGPALPTETAPGITGHWAQAYISDCVQRGIFFIPAGGFFDPDGAVTGAEAANMLLAASGTESAAGLFEGYSADPSAPLTRDGAALLVYNALPLFQSVQTLAGLDGLVAPNGIVLAEDGGILLTDLYYQAVWQRQGGTFEPVASIETPWAIAPFLDGWAVSDRDNNVLYLLVDGTVQTINGHTSENLPKTQSGVVFDLPTGLAAGEDGSLYVSDTGSGAIRRISNTGEVTTVAAGLASPTGLCWSDGVLYAAETEGNRILKIENKKTTVLAGTGEDGCADGAADSAMFSIPQGVLVDGGVVYVADTGNGCIRRIEDGRVSTIPFPAEDVLVSPVGLALDGGTLYICDSFTRAVYKLPLSER